MVSREVCRLLGLFMFRTYSSTCLERVTENREGSITTFRRGNRYNYKVVGEEQDNGLTTTREALDNLRAALDDKLREDMALTNTRWYGKNAYPESDSRP